MLVPQTSESECSQADPSPSDGGRGETTMPIRSTAQLLSSPGLTYSFITDGGHRGRKYGTMLYYDVYMNLVWRNGFYSLDVKLLWADQDLNKKKTGLVIPIFGNSKYFSIDETETSDKTEFNTRRKEDDWKYMMIYM